ncbi:hypothetical protein GUJ93_ZPchr0013g33982 [Zizania palustris]|uniref:DUF6821 domain-containing protein n=1 Tax=Zizania palustris TaxID=103762 RepID=A0A8J5WZN4_ZIZPA|nr:hypothetical protein GUJ93_ZPchr0013g33982 [Zizania palustris]
MVAVAPDQRVEDEEGVEKDRTGSEHNGFSVGKLRVNGVGALCSFGVAAATSCIFLLGGWQLLQKRQNQKNQFQMYGDNERIQQVVQQASRLNQAVSTVMGGVQAELGMDIIACQNCQQVRKQSDNQNEHYSTCNSTFQDQHDVHTLQRCECGDLPTGGAWIWEKEILIYSAIFSLSEKKNWPLNTTNTYHHVGWFLPSCQIQVTDYLFQASFKHLLYALELFYTGEQQRMGSHGVDTGVRLVKGGALGLLLKKSRGKFAALVAAAGFAGNLGACCRIRALDCVGRGRLREGILLRKGGILRPLEAASLDREAPLRERSLRGSSSWSALRGRARRCSLKGASMRDFPSCFGESGVQIADASSSSSSAGKGAAQNLVTCLYQTQFSGRPCVISVTWSKSLMGQGLSIGVDDLSNQCLCKADIKPWLFSKKKGSKRLDVDDGKIEIFWDLSGAKFGAGPEPLEGFYVAVVFDLELILLLGDMKKDAYRKTGVNRPMLNAAFVARREHIYGKKIYTAKAQFCDNGQCHDVVIECDTVGLKDPCLEIRVDKKPVMQDRYHPDEDPEVQMLQACNLMEASNSV